MRFSLSLSQNDDYLGEWYQGDYESYTLSYDNIYGASLQEVITTLCFQHNVKQIVIAPL